MRDVKMVGSSSSDSSIEDTETTEESLRLYRLSFTIARLPDFLRDPFFLEADWCLLGTGCILGVRNQQHTEGCYAIVVVTLLYADMYQNEQIEPCQASAQELVDFLAKATGTVVTSTRGNPASFDHAFTYVKLFGLFPEDIYPWKGYFDEEPKKDYLDEPDIKIYIDDFHWIENDNHSAVMERLKTQPVAAGMFSDYTRIEDGIIQALTPEQIEEVHRKIERLKRMGEIYAPYHAITLIGYGGVEGINEYYLSQNSYGTDYGHDGYFTIRRKAVFCFCYPVGTKRRERRNVVELTERFAQLDISGSERRERRKVVELTETFAQLDISGSDSDTGFETMAAEYI